MHSNPNSNEPRSAGNSRQPLKPPASNGSSRYPLATPVEDDDDATFRVAPDAIDNSSILASLSSGPLSGLHSSVSNSRVDLLSHLRPKGEESASLSHTEAIHAMAPPTIPIEDDSDHFDVTQSTNEESSAVDLGSRQEIEMPFLAGSQASAGSAVLDTMPRRAPSSVQLNGSAAGSFRSSTSGLGSAAQSRRWNTAWKENKQTVAWGGGALAGFVGCGVLVAALSAAGLVHVGSSAAAPAPANPRFAAELRHSGLRSNELQNRAEEFQAQASAARAQVADTKAQLDVATRDLQLAQAEHAKRSDEIRQLRQQVAAAHESADRARAEQRTAIERALQESNDRVARLTADQSERLRALQQAAAKQAQVEAAQAAAARQSLSDFQRVVNQKLADAQLASANAKPEELLAAVDHAILHRTTAIEIDSPNADRLLSNGLRAYRDRDFAEAEKSLAEAAKANGNDARIRYLLGLARRHLGRADDAQTDFYVAAALERKYQPSPREVDEILVRLPISDRGVIGQFRP